MKKTFWWLGLIFVVVFFIFALIVAYTAIASNIEEQRQQTILKEKQRREEAKRAVLQSCLEDVEDYQRTNEYSVRSFYASTENDPKWQQECDRLGIPDLPAIHHPAYLNLPDSKGARCVDILPGMMLKDDLETIKKEADLKRETCYRVHQ